MLLPLAITIFFVLLYSVFMVLLAHGMGKLRRTRKQLPLHAQPVTIVIPFRDESAWLPGLVSDLETQSYSSDLIEIIFVNDHSEDGSQELLDSLVAENTSIKCLELPSERSGKKEALSHGIERASNEWIIQIDADCRIGTNFVASHMAFHKEYPSDLVAGLVTIRKGEGGFLEAYERLDMLSLVGTGAGSFYYQRPVMCNGANLSYSKEVYMESRRFDPSEKVASGDDMFLMIGARKTGKNLLFNPAREARVETISTNSMRELIAQRIRWGAKSVYYKMPDIQLLACVVAITNLAILISPVWIILTSEVWLWFLLVWGVKTMADFNLLVRITGITDQRRSLWYFLPVSLVYYFNFLMIATGSLFKRSDWD